MINYLTDNKCNFDCKQPHQEVRYGQTAMFADCSGLSLLSRLALFFLWLYQKTLILRQPSCRFYPSCSQYMAVGIRRFGFFRGLFLGLKRLCKCHPYHEGGIDDVPDHFSLLR